MTIKNILAKDVADKAISVGEKSFLTINQLNISSSRIGIASKDSSKVEGKKIKYLIVDFMTLQFIKKSYFSGAYLNIKGETSCKNSLVQVGSELFK